MRESVRAGRSWGCAAAARITSQKAPECSVICKENSSLSSEAAAFYYENRYTAYEECSKPCKSLKVISNLKYKRKSDKDKTSGQVKLFFPREVQITEEIVVKSPLSLGLF